jgi:hypothetical protein
MRNVLLIGTLSLIGILPVASGQDNKTDRPSENTKTVDVHAGKPGPGMVWVDAKTKTYYRQGDRLYGKTKKGEYMSEGDAANLGYTDKTQKPIKN